MITTLFTSSYRNDLDRAVWMRRSVNRFLKDTCRHIIAVPHGDLPIFKARFRNDSNVEITCQGDAVNRIFYPDILYWAVSRIAKPQLWRFESHAGRPGWIIQQIAKLNCIHWIKQGALLLIDSDEIFTRPFHLQDLGINDVTRTLIRITPADEVSRHREHLSKSREILSLPPGSTEHHYISHPAILYADWLASLHHHLERTHETDWQTVLYRAGHISEYSIYGAFVEEVLKPANLVLTTSPIHRGVWDRASFDSLKSSIQNMRDATDHSLDLVVQSNIGIPVTEYEEVLRRIIDS